MKKDLEKIEKLKKQLEGVWTKICLYPNEDDKYFNSYWENPEKLRKWNERKRLGSEFSDIKGTLLEAIKEPIICHDCGINLDENIIVKQSHIITDTFVPRNEYIRLIHHYTKPIGCCKPKYYAYNPIKKFIKGGGLVDVGLPGLAVVACFRDIPPDSVPLEPTDDKDIFISKNGEKYIINKKEGDYKELPGAGHFFKNI